MILISPPAVSLNNPHTMTVIGTSLYVASIGCSSYLFLQRVHTIYADNTRIKLFFSIFWLSYCLLEVTIILGVRLTFIPGTHHFQDAGVHPILALSIFISILFDSSIFVAIFYKVVSTHASVDNKV